MAVKPILFSGPMVLAMLHGQKTMTRRVLKEGPTCPAACYGTVPCEVCKLKLPFNKDDILWVRESWCAELAFDETKPSDLGPNAHNVLYLADEQWSQTGVDKKSGRNRPSIFMPRWANRLTLAVTEVRVERLSDISETDAVAEGMAPQRTPNGWWTVHYFERKRGGQISAPHAVGAFRLYWDALNEDRGFGWRSNPWVSVTSYTVHRQNVDAFLEERAV